MTRPKRSLWTGRGRNLRGVVNYGRLLRAALANLDRWVTEGVAPPPSCHPRVADGTAVDPATYGSAEYGERLYGDAGIVTYYEYDKVGNLEYETDPIGKKVRHTYYDNGLLKETYDATSGDPGTLLG